MVKAYDVQLSPIGNGTASRETDFLQLIKKHQVTSTIIIVNEAGTIEYYEHQKLLEMNFLIFK